MAFRGYLLDAIESFFVHLLIRQYYTRYSTATIVKISVLFWHLSSLTLIRNLLGFIILFSAGSASQGFCSPDDTSLAELFIMVCSLLHERFNTKQPFGRTHNSSDMFKRRRSLDFSEMRPQWLIIRLFVGLASIVWLPDDVFVRLMSR